jgi:hypothetical protein
MNEHWMSSYSTYILLRLCLFRFEQHITKLLLIIAYALYQHCSQVSQWSRRHVFWYRRNLLPNRDLKVIDGRWFSGIHFHFEVPPKEIITGREIRRTCRPWTLTAQWTDILRKHFPNDLYGCSCTILLVVTICSRAQFYDDSVLVWGSSVTFQHDKQLWLNSKCHVTSNKS